MAGVAPLPFVCSARLWEKQMIGFFTHFDGLFCFFRPLVAVFNRFLIESLLFEANRTGLARYKSAVRLFLTL